MQAIITYQEYSPALKVIEAFDKIKYRLHKSYGFGEAEIRIDRDAKFLKMFHNYTKTFINAEKIEMPHLLSVSAYSSIHDLGMCTITGSDTSFRFEASCNLSLGDRQLSDGLYLLSCKIKGFDLNVFDGKDIIVNESEYSDIEHIIEFDLAILNEENFYSEERSDNILADKKAELKIVADKVFREHVEEYENGLKDRNDKPSKKKWWQVL